MVPVIGGALYSSIEAKVHTHNVAAYLNSNLTVHSVNTLRFSYGLADYGFEPVSEPLLLPSTLNPGTPFLLNRSLLLNVTQPSGPTQFATAESNSEYSTLLANASNIGISDLPATVLKSYGKTEAITGPIGQVNVGGFSPLGVDVFNYPQWRGDQTLQFSDTYGHEFPSFKSIRRQTLTMGLELWGMRLHSTLNQNARAQVNFFGERNLTNVAQSIQPFVSSTDLVAAGVPFSLYQTLTSTPATSLNLHRTQPDLFVQDQLKIVNDLTVLVGARVELNGLPQSDDSRFKQTFDVSTFMNQLTNASSGCTNDVSYCETLVNSLIRAFPGNFNDVFGANRVGKDIRLGFAWNPEGGPIVVRGGFGTYSGQFPEIILSQSRSAFPQYLPMNLANAPEDYFYLFNVANPYECIQLNNPHPGSPSSCTVDFLNNTLNQLPPNSNTDFLFARLFNRVATLTPTEPGPHLQNPYSLQYHMTVERRVGRESTWSIAYVGTQGRHLLGVETPDPPLATGISLNSVASLHRTLFPGIATNSLSRPVGLPYISRTLFTSDGDSSYNSLQAQFAGTLGETHLGRLSFSAAFTYGHAIDDVSDFFPLAGGPSLPQDSFYPSERGSSAFDERLRFAGSLLWSLPSPTAKGLIRSVLEDWRLASITTAQTGQPFTATTSIDVNQDGNITDRLNTTQGLISTADRRIVFRLANGVSPEALLSPVPALLGAGASCINSATNHNSCNGSVGRNTFRAPGLFDVDLALIRDLRVGHERPADLQFRTEVFNSFNHAQFGTPVTVLEEPGFGSSTATVSPNRIIQFAAKLSF